MKKILVLLSVLWHALSQSQTLKTTLGNETDVVLNDVQDLDGNIFCNYFLTYANRVKSKAFDINFLSLENASQANEKHIEIPNIGKNESYFEKLMPIDNQLFLFSKVIDEKKRTNTLYVTKVNPGAVLAGDPKQIDQIVAKEDFVWGYGTYQFISSPDNKLLMIIHFLPDARAEFSCMVVDKSLRPLWQKDFSLPETYDYNPYSGFILTNEGSVYFKGQVLKDKTQRIKGKPTYFSYVYYYNSKENKLNELKLDLNEKFVQDNELKIINGQVIFAGLYSNKYFKTSPSFGVAEFIVDGAFWMTIDEKCTQILKAGTMDLLPLVTEPKEELRNQRLKAVYLMSDGGVALVSERFLFKGVSVRGAGSTRMVGTNMSYFYYDNILVMKMYENSGLNWMRQIKKSQISLMDPGVSSFLSLSDDNNIHIIYNKQKELLQSGDTVYKKPKTKIRMMENPVTWQTTYANSGKIIENQPLFKNDEEFFLFPYNSFITNRNDVFFYGEKGRISRFARLSIVK